MKIAICFMYVVLSFIYLSMGNSSAIWGGINIITQIAFIGWLSYLAERIKGNSEIEALFFKYIKLLSVANCIYIAVCMIREEAFAWYNTNVFAYIMGIGFLVFLIHFAYKKS